MRFLPLLSPNWKACFIWDLQRKKYSPNGGVCPEGGKIWGTQSQRDALTIPGEKDLSIGSAFPGSGMSQSSPDALGEVGMGRAD